MANINNKYSRFLINLLFLLILLFLLDRIIGGILKHYYFKQESGLNYRTTYVLDSTKADILVFGSSRANHHYVPTIFEDSLGLTFYNSGREGNFLLYNFAVFKSAISRYKPKVIIFDVFVDELSYQKQEYERLSALLPYYKQKPAVRDIINLRSPFEQYKLVSSIYPYNSSLLTIVMGNLKQNEERKTDNNGYIALLGQIEDTLLKDLGLVETRPDINKINALMNIINICDSAQINLFFIQSPLFAKVESTYTTDYFEKLFKDDKIVFWNFISDSLFLNNPHLFKDKFHLNDSGARVFTRTVVDKIINSKSQKQSTASFI